MKSYVLAANSSKAVLYSIEHLKTGELKAVGQFEHPQSRQKWSELISDKVGHGHTDRPGASKIGQTGRGAASDRIDPKAAEAEHFARELAEQLSAACSKESCDSLVIVAPPHFHGVLKKVITTHFSHTWDVTKDYTTLRASELIKRIREHLFP